MKNVLKLALVAAGVFTFAQSQANPMAQDTTIGHKVSHTAKKVGHTTARTAKKVGHATATTAKKVGHETGEAAKTVGHETGEAATKVAHKTAEVSAKGAAAITDKKYEGKCGPHGETIYINKDSRYFYVDKKGHRVYVTKSHLMDASKMKMKMEKED